MQGLVLQQNHTFVANIDSFIGSRFRVGTSVLGVPAASADILKEEFWKCEQAKTACAALLHWFVR